MPLVLQFTCNSVVSITIQLDQASRSDAFLTHSAYKSVFLTGRSMGCLNNRTHTNGCVAFLTEDAIDIAVFSTGSFLASRICFTMSCCFNLFSPLDYRATAIAVVAAGITSFSTSCSLVFQFDNSMLMVGVAVRNLISDHGGSHRFGTADFIHITCNSLNITVQNGVVDGYSGLVCGSGLRLFSHVVKTIPGPYAYRNAQKSLLTGQCTTFLTGQYNRNHVIHSMDVSRAGKSCHTVPVIIQANILYLEARSHDHVFQFPSICSVQLNDCLDNCDFFCSRSLNVYIIDRVGLGNISKIIMTREFNQSALFANDSKFVGQLSAVTPVILNFEGNTVLTIGQVYISLGSYGGLSDLSLYFVAINVNLRRSQIQTGNFTVCSGLCNRCGKANRIAIDFYIVGQCNAFVGSSIGSIGNHGCITVFHSCAVVESDVVNVEGQLSRGFRLDVSTHPRRRTRVGFIGCGHSRQIGILADIDRSVYPAVCRNILFRATVQVLTHTADSSEHKVILHTTHLGRIGNMIGVTVELRLECQTGSTLRNVQPEAQSSSVQTVRYITEYAHLTYIEQDVVGPATEAGIRVIIGNTQRILTVLHLTIFSSCQESMRIIFRAELTSQRIGTNQRVIYAVGNTPCLGIGEAHPIRHIAIFKVPACDELRTLTELDIVADRRNCLRILVCYCQRGALLALIAGSSIGQRIRIPCTNSSVRELPDEGIRLIVHIPIVHTVQHSGCKCNALSVRNYGAISTEADRLRMYNVDDLLEGLATNSELYSNLTQSAVRYKYTISDSTIGIIGQRPYTALRHFHRSTGSVNSFCGEGVGGVRSKVVISRMDLCNLKDARSHALCLGNKNSIQCRTLRTIGGNRAHGQAGFACTLRNKGGRTTTITVECPYTAQRQHHFAHFVVTLTHRVVGATAIRLAKNQRAVGLNTNHGTGSRSRSTFYCRTGQLTILDQPTEVCTNAVPVVSFKGLVIATQLNGTILLNSKVCSTRTAMLIQPIITQAERVINILQHLTFPHQERVGSIAVICQSSIHTTNNIIAQLILVVCSHISDLRSIMICLIGRVAGVLINLIITGD